MVTQGTTVSAGFRYQQLAAELEEKISSGLYKVGERLPSLRDLHNRTGLSITTVAQAYVELEARGMVEPREKSGYFVRPQLHNLLPAPQMGEQSATRPRKVTVNSLAESILSVIHDPEMLPFGAALPACQLLPVGQLAASARTVAGRYFADGGLNYGPPDGIAALKRQIAARSIGFGSDVDAEGVIVTNGCMDAIQLCLRAVARPGDIVVTESPTFTCYLQLIEELGLLALEIPTDPSTGIDLNLLEEALFNGAWRRNRVAACLLNPSFQNPLGFEMPVQRKAELVDMLAAHEIPLIEDDIYGELHFGPVRPAPLKSFDAKGLVLYCSSFSKTLVPDFRVGWIVPGRFRERILRLKFNSSIAQSKLQQMVVADFLETGKYDRHLRKLRVALKNQVSSATQAIARYFPEGTKLTAPHGGFILWVELAANVDGVELFHLAKAEKIFVIPGAISSGAGRFKNCVRISCGAPWNEQMEGGMRRLGRLAAMLQAR
ncbi:PLP-dependent aminotransferase family protein [Desulfobulbus sp.]|uniref:aminotransferase-like domain-containing protein n=1 Tax=Desulfobulbus sp. TaxID=895 RepID=UPI0027BB1EF2|nr:PLP-dependent aminotransferase family protein [Desulfobulbus sp.]